MMTFHFCSDRRADVPPEPGSGTGLIRACFDGLAHVRYDYMRAAMKRQLEVS